MSVSVRVRFCPKGKLTFDDLKRFERIPNRGESILVLNDEGGDDRYVVVEIDWQFDGSPFLIAHEAGRPRARSMLGGVE